MDIKKSKNKVVLLSLRDVDPLLRDGASKTLLERLKLIQSMGCRVSLINFLPDEAHNRVAFAKFKSTQSDSSDIKCETASQTSILGIESWHELLPYPFEQLPENSPQVLGKLIKKLTEAQPDFVLTSGESLYPLTAATLLNYPGAHSYHSLANIEGCARDPAHTRLLRNRLIFTTSAFLQSQVHHLLDCESIVWYPPLTRQLNTTNSLPEACANQELYDIGFVTGGWIKGDPLVENLADQLPEFSFLIVGGYHHTTPAKKADNMTYLGWIEDMDAFYHRIRLLVVPSLIPEGFGRVILEGVTYGLPVIANRVGGIPEAMGESGVLLDVSLDSQLNLDKLTEQYQYEIQRILSDQKIYQHYQKKALKRAHLFRAQQSAAAHEIISRHILGSEK